MGDSPMLNRKPSKPVLQSSSAPIGPDSSDSQKSADWKSLPPISLGHAANPPLIVKTAPGRLLSQEEHQAFEQKQRDYLKA